MKFKTRKFNLYTWEIAENKVFILKIFFFFTILQVLAYILLEYSLGHITLLFKNITNFNEIHPMRSLVTNFKIELDLLNASQTFCT